MAATPPDQRKRQRLAEPYDCPDCGQAHIRGCRGHKDWQRAIPCRNWPRRGTTVCDAHGGNAPQVKAKAAVRAEIQNWGLGDTTLDPGVVLLRLVTQSAWRVERYAAAIQRAVDDAGGDLEKALTGDTYTVGEDGRAVKTGEYIRAMTRLEGEERDRCASFATKAVAAGLAERQVKLAERQGAMMAGVILAVLGDLGVSVDGEQVRGLVAAHVERATGLAIEGSPG